MTIIGVAPKGFEGTTLGSAPIVFVPITMRGACQPGFNGFDQPQRAIGSYLFARLKPGVSIEQAQRADQRGLPSDHQRRRGAAAEGHERADDGEVQGRRRSRSRTGGADKARCTSEAQDAAHPAVRRSPASCCSSPAPTSPTCCWRAPPIARRRWPCACRSARRAGSCSCSCSPNRWCSPCSAAS